MLKGYSPTEARSLARFNHPDSFIVVGFFVDGLPFCVQHREDTGVCSAVSIMMGALAPTSQEHRCTQCGERLEDCEPLLTSDGFAIL